MWSIGIQRELSKDMALEVSYVGNRGAWWNSDGVLTDPNRVTPAILSAHNFDPTLANTTDDAVLTDAIQRGDPCPGSPVQPESAVRRLQGYCFPIAAAVSRRPAASRSNGRRWATPGTTHCR